MKKKIINILLIVSLVIMLYFVGRCIYGIVNNASVLFSLSQTTEHSMLIYYFQNTIESLITNIISFIFVIFVLFVLIFTFIFINKNNFTVKKDLQKERQENKRKKLEKQKEKIEKQLINIK